MTSIEDINEFFDRLLYSDQYMLYHGVEYFFEGCCCEFDDQHRILSAFFVIYQLPNYEEVYSVTAAAPAACIDQFIQEFRLDGKTIHELLPELEFAPDT